MMAAPTIEDVLQALVLNEDSETAQKLLKSCTLICDNNWNDLRTLEYALIKKDKQMIECLLKKGCRIADGIERCVKTSSTLYYAILMDDVEIVQTLLKRGARLNHEEPSKQTTFEFAMKSGSPNVIGAILAFESRGFTKLHLACLRNDLAAVEFALKNDQDINVAVSAESPDWPGFTALHFAVVYRREQLIEILLKSGADLKIADAKNMTSLHRAISRRDESIIKCILNVCKATNLNSIDNHGITVLHIACILKDPNFVKELLQQQVCTTQKISEPN